MGGCILRGNTEAQFKHALRRVCVWLLVFSPVTWFLERTSQRLWLTRAERAEYCTRDLEPRNACTKERCMGRARGGTEWEVVGPCTHASVYPTGH